MGAAANGVGSSRDPLERAAAIVRRSRRVVVLSGAGISTDSGIQDFRGPNGLWTKNPEAERASMLDVYLSEPDVRRRAWQHRLTSPIWEAKPNAGHLALVELQHSGRLDTLVTQNIDGLHQAAGTDPERVIEIHGTTLEVVCMRCGDRQPAEPVHDRVRAGEDDPACRLCGGILKPATISFGQSLVANDLHRAEVAAERCDLLLAVGSTLGVYPAAGLVPIAKRCGAAVVIVNGGPTELDPLADVVVLGSLSEVLTDMMAAAFG
jgi:NAD-dependent deacetylase